MKIYLSKLKVKNFRGIQDATTQFKRINIFVGNNGTGKTTIHSLVARLIPILRDEDPRLFLDSDFNFTGETECQLIEINYEVEISLTLSDLGLDNWQQLSNLNLENVLDSNLGTEEQKLKILIKVISERGNQGANRVHLNDQAAGNTQIEFKTEGNVDLSQVIEVLRNNCSFHQKIISNGWTNRIAPIILDTSEEQRHAATSIQDQAGFFDGLRARLVEILNETERGNEVNNRHQNLKTNILDFVKEFLEEDQFVDVKVNNSNQLILGKADGSWQPWDGLSGGEQSAFNLAMVKEFERIVKNDFIIFDEPENNFHPAIANKFLDSVKSIFGDCQMFIATHSPFIFKNSLNDSQVNLLITKRNSQGISIENFDNSRFLFPWSPSWGEISFKAYDLATVEFHNELYGHIEKNSPNNIENYFTNKGILKNKQWTKERNGLQQGTIQVTLMTFIRHSIHHPENQRNLLYTPAELKLSIEEMISIIENP